MAYTEPDKVVDLTEAAGLVADGDVVALGGALSYREPMALVRELIRQGRRDLHVVGSAHGIDVDLLVGAGAVRVVEESYVGYEQDFGLAPAYRRAAEAGALEVRESCCYTILQQLRAAEYGIPFMPVRGILGTDIRRLHPEYAEIRCPFTDQRLVAVPALAPDVALIHGLMADRRGNVHLLRPLVLDERFTFAARKVVVTVERVASEPEVAEAGVVLPYFAVTAVVEAPFGAHPTSCYPHYTYDRAHLGEWVKAAADDHSVGQYLRRYVLAPGSEAAYRDMVGADRLAALGEWSISDERWLELLS
ncbi:MAG TPA: CoA-transferase [Actinomycetes bacterium]|jgi:glutaconate CoA-transferase subunit A|nr:CoA-transferase [Actinomycetes bacterium]